MQRKIAPFLLVLCAFLGLLILSYFPYDFKCFGFKFRNVNIKSQIENILNSPDSMHEHSSVYKDTLKKDDLSIDSLLALTFSINLDSILEQDRKDLRLSSYTDTLLFSRFFPSLKSVRDSSSCTRIAYFGDSMIEGDLISQTLRDDLQNKLGGKGVGFVPITSIVSKFRRSIKHEFSDDWKEFSIQKTKELKNFAPSGFVFNPKIITSEELKDTLQKSQVSYVRYTAPDDNYERLSHFYLTKLYYGKTKPDTYIKYYIDGKMYKANLPGNSEVNELILNRTKPYKEILIEFYTDTVIDVYGVSFESPKGVFVDNYAVRGNLGMALKKIPENLLQKFNEHMNYSLLIFQFGLNVASPEARGFKWYENAMVEVVEYYSKLIPEADILIISIGDKSYKYDMEYVTQPGIPKLVEAQRNIAKRTKSHFWNLYQTMGGYNSMRTWVESSKPLASKDYAHINFRGAEKISKTLSENIFNEFQLYEYNLLKDKEKQILFEAIAELNSKLNNNFLSFSSQYENVILNNSLLSKSDGTRNIEPSDVEEHNDTTDKGLIKADTVIDSYEFRVQIAASKSEIEMNSYNHLLQKAPDKILRKIQHKDGFKRLYITPFYSFKEAQAVADTLIQNGHDAFVVGFINEDRAAIEKVKSKQKEYLASNTINSTPKQEDINIPEETDTDASIKFVKLKEYPRWLKVLSFDDIYYQRFYEKDTLMNYTLGWRIDTVLTSPTLIHGELPVFRVQFCASEIELDVDFYQNIIDFFGDSMIIISKDDDGMIRYMLGDYASFEDASEALNTVFELKQDGFITAYYYNKRIKPERAISIIKNKTKQ